MSAGAFFLYIFCIILYNCLCKKFGSETLRWVFNRGGEIHLPWVTWRTDLVGLKDCYSWGCQCHNVQIDYLNNTSFIDIYPRKLVSVTQSFLAFIMVVYFGVGLFFENSVDIIVPFMNLCVREAEKKLIQGVGCPGNLEKTGWKGPQKRAQGNN